MNDTSKLPRWAQNEIAKLRSDVLNLEGQLAKAIGAEPTRVQVNPYATLIGRSHKCFLHARETVRFSFGERDFIDVQLNGDKLEIMGGDTLRVSPRAANVIWISPSND